jgi:E3 ubiquitin-protein ligase HECTD1
LTPTEDISHDAILNMSKLQSQMSQSIACEEWYGGLLNHADFEIIDPHRAKFLQQLTDLASQRQNILNNNELKDFEKQANIQNLTLCDPPVKLEEMCLNFTFNPSSKIYGYDVYELKYNGVNEEVCLENLEEYIELIVDFYFNLGIRRQMNAFRAGFIKVFSMEKLYPFSPEELQLMLCGSQDPQWTKEDITNYTEPKLGYTRESPGFKKFVNVLSNMSGDERKSFLQFTTGCSSLPPGGLANLHPRLTIVRKVDGNDKSYPSVNTCVHYLKLPDYSSEQIMREKLLHATSEKGFHLN